MLSCEVDRHCRSEQDENSNKKTNKMAWGSLVENHNRMEHRNLCLPRILVYDIFSVQGHSHARCVISVCSHMVNVVPDEQRREEMAATDKQPLLAACEAPQLDEKKSKTKASRSSSIVCFSFRDLERSEIKLGAALSEPVCINLVARCHVATQCLMLQVVDDNTWQPCFRLLFKPTCVVPCGLSQAPAQIFDLK
jgi:hypothetical protein